MTVALCLQCLRQKVSKGTLDSKLVKEKNMRDCGFIISRNGQSFQKQ
jgi:hypothetical protein